MRGTLLGVAAALLLLGVPAPAQAAIEGPAVRINAGGGAFTALSGAAFAADSAFTGGSTYSTSQPISGLDGPLYQDERWGQFSYAIPVANGTYDVRLHFVEIYYGTAQPGGAGKRVFGMDVLDTPASPDLANIDIYAAVGARTPLVRTVSGVTVTDGALNLRSVYGSADDPELAAVEVVSTTPLPAPTVSGRTPANGATAVPAATRPTATFSRDMDPASLTASSFTLTRAGGASVTATVSYDAPARTATLTPSTPLAHNASYTAQVSTAVKASDGQPLAAADSWSFATGDPPPPDVEAPTVSVTSPSDGATVSGTITVNATAADNVGVEGVQFQADGADLGAEDTAAPFSRGWNTSGLTPGLHTLSAVARDAAGNRTTSTVIRVTVDNPAVDPTGLVGAWGLEEGNGTTVEDASPAGNDGTVSGAQWTDGRFGNALDFDGTNDWVTVPDAASLDLSTAMTLEAWVRPSFLGGWRTALLKEGSGAMSYALYGSATNDVPSAHLTTGSEQDTKAPSALPINTWSHLAATWDGTTLRLYVNGTQASSKAIGGTIGATSGALRIGGNSLWGEYFKGALDELRIYRRALSPAEVQTDMTSPVHSDAAPPPGPETRGQMSAPQSWPLVPVHIASLSDGKIAVWDGFDAALNSERIWDPATNTFTPIPSGRNLFCAAHVTLPDGRLFIAGGHIAAYEGLKDTQILNPATRTWFRGTDMARARWYPTATTLPDGRILVVSGDNVTFAPPGTLSVPLTNGSETLPEIYDVAQNTWTPLPAGQRRMALYPFMFVLPNGKLFDAGPDLTTRTFDTTTGQWSVVGNSPISGHSAVMYRPGKILKSGTWSDPDFPNQVVTNRAVAIDMSDAAPAWRDVAPMHYQRSYHTLTALPDGTVLSSGGGTSSDGVDHSKAVLTPEIWDPATDKWTPMATGQRARLYHSSALLLQDGRVLLAGGGAFGSAQNETNAEIFSPPYLFKGPRPVIGSAPANISLGETFSVSSPDAARVQSASLVRMGSVTHNFDMDQRYMALTVRQGATAGTLSLDAPTSANVAPPGYYYLFLKDDKGVPSVGAIIRVSGAAADTQPPTAPGGLTATPDADTVELDWTAATDDTGVTEYRVHRAASAGFTPNAGNRIATVTSGTSHADRNLAPGAYHYVVVAADAAGNAGPASADAVATVVADTTAPTATITAPAAGATVAGSTTVTATAADDRAVTSVQFKLDGANLGAADASAPYSVPWNTTTVADGAHELVAVARDAAGNTGASASIGVDVDNGSPPTVSLTAPAAGATVSTTVPVTADATDDRGVASVQFKLDGANLGAADTAAPWTVSWDTRTAANGSHTLTAVARDTDGATTTSAPRSVTVANTVTAPAGLVAAYGFEEPSGTTAIDATGHGLAGTISGAVRTTPGRFGSALSFDGVNDWVTIPDAPLLDLSAGMTLEAWVKPTAFASKWRTVVLKEQSGGLAYSLYANTNGNRPSANVFTASETETRGTAQLSSTAWTHLAGTYDGGTLRLYVNGSQVSSVGATGAIVGTGGALRLGGNGVWSEWFKGLIDEVRVYDRALSAAELASDMNIAVAGAP